MYTLYGTLQYAELHLDSISWWWAYFLCLSSFFFPPSKVTATLHLLFLPIQSNACHSTIWFWQQTENMNKYHMKFWCFQVFPELPSSDRPKRYFILMIIVTILECSSSQGYTFDCFQHCCIPSAAFMNSHYSGTTASSCRRKFFFLWSKIWWILEDLTKIVKMCTLPTSNWSQSIWEVTKTILSKALDFIPVQQITFAVHLVRINSFSRGTGIQCTWYNTPYSDQILTRSDGYRGMASFPNFQ